MSEITRQGKILQVLPSVIRSIDGELAIEIDFLNSLRFYLKNFKKVAVACPLTEDEEDFGLKNCVPVKELSYGDSLELIPLPQAYSFHQFVKNYRSVRALLREKIQEFQYLEFSPHALVGDWSAIACLEAIKQKRPYVISASVVYHDVARIRVQRSILIKRLIKESVSFPLMKQYHRFLYRNAQLGLIQGQATFDEYARFFSRSGIFYNVTITKDDRISDEQLAAKIAAISSQETPLQICYVGRAVEMKGGIEWVRALNHIVKSGVPVKASWIGDGALLNEMRSLAERLEISDHVSFLGYVADRQKVFNAILNSHIFMFCHKTSESPRCLIEALALGSVLTGYRNAYPSELVKVHGGGRFVDMGDWLKLAETVKSMHENRAELVTLIRNAARSGAAFDREAAYAHRLSLLKSSYE